MDGKTVESDKSELPLEFLKAFIMDDRVVRRLSHHPTVEEALAKPVEG